MTARAELERLTNLCIQEFNGINYHRIGESLIEDNTNKGLQIWNDLKVSFEEFRVHQNNFENRGENITLIECGILCAVIMAACLLISIQFVKLTHYIRTRVVLSVIREIDINKPIHELNKLDMQLSEFIEHNHLTAVDGYDEYPSHLIREGREQLNRVSLSYGKQIQLNITEKGSKRIESANDQLKVELSETPFLNGEQLRVFYHLHENFNVPEKKRWTYIFNTLKTECKVVLSESQYFGFICDKFEIVAKRPQTTANDSVLYDQLKQLLNDM